MLSTVVSIISCLNGLFNLVMNLFGKKPAAPVAENTQAIEVSNKAGALSAGEARMTRAETDKEIAANAHQTDADLAAVRDAGSLRDGADAINRAIARTRSHPGADS